MSPADMQKVHPSAHHDPHNTRWLAVQLLQEIEQKAQFCQQQMVIVKSQMNSKSRENRMLQLTAAELDGLPSDANVYEGVGKMWACTTHHLLWYSLWHAPSRFVASPKTDVKVRLTRDQETIKKDMEGLDKKMHYLETTFNNSKTHLDAIFKNGGRWTSQQTH
jgi:prefoldin subunit 1